MNHGAAIVLFHMDMRKLLPLFLAWFVITGVLLVLGYMLLITGSAFGVSVPHLAWKRRPAIRRARRGITEVARQRVPNAEVVCFQGASAISPWHLGFCIRTGTDEDRDLLRRDPQIHQEFRNALVRAGYPMNAVLVVPFGIESQETVDRDYGGSWDKRTETP